MVLDGDHGGHVTSSHLTLTLTAQHHGAVVTCEAFNEIVGKRVHDSFTLTVRRKFTPHRTCLSFKHVVDYAHINLGKHREAIGKV
jgi:hypothetical protein